MATCGHCGAEARRFRMIFHESAMEEMCENCAPLSFEPRWRTEPGHMAWDEWPNRYKKITLPDGRTGYEATDEMRVDTEAKIAKPCQEDVDARGAALKRRREWCAAQPKKLTPAQIESAKNRRDLRRAAQEAAEAGLWTPEQESA